MSSVVVELELELELMLDDEEGEAAVSLVPELPHAARLRGRARPSTAMLLRRASRMMWLLALGRSDTGGSELRLSRIGLCPNNFRGCQSMMTTMEW
jgi:hypothetical protein